jgi:hypothetical protein
MLVGFANMLLSVWDAERPRTVFVGFDSIGHPTYRHELLPQYQSGRDFPPELTDQLDRLPDFVEALGFPWAKAAGYEADDFLAAAVLQEEDRSGETLVLTSDRDLFQLASEKTTILMPKRGVSELQRVGPAEVRERYGVDPVLARCAATRRTGFQARAASATVAPRPSSRSTRHSTRRSSRASSRTRRTCSASTRESRASSTTRRYRTSRPRSRTGPTPASSPASGG